MCNEYLNNPVKHLPRIKDTAFIMTSDIISGTGLDGMIFNAFMQ